MLPSRRSFLKFGAMLSLLPFATMELIASPNAKSESIGSTHMDEFFDPDGWL